MPDDYTTTKEEIPDRLEPFEGWRIWRMNSDGLLTAAFHDDIWPAGQPMKAECAYKNQMKPTEEGGQPARKPHTAPGSDCTCGIYAGNEPLPIYKMMGQQSGTFIAGTAKLWGKVTVHESGWRASLAYPKLLYVPDDKMTEMKLKLQEFYPNVEVAPMSVFKAAMDILIGKEKRARIVLRSRSLMTWVFALWAVPAALGVIIPTLGIVALKVALALFGGLLGAGALMVGASFVKEFLTAEMSMQRSDYIFGALIVSFLGFFALLALSIGTYGYLL